MSILKAAGNASESCEPEMQLAAAAAIAERAGQEVVAKVCDLAPRLRRKVLTVFRRQLFPPGKPGRRDSKEITAAYVDWQNGLRGAPLYRKHVPGFDQMSRWKRQAKTRALLDAIRGRKRRDQIRASAKNIQ